MGEGWGARGINVLSFSPTIFEGVTSQREFSHSPYAGEIYDGTSAMALLSSNSDSELCGVH